MKAFRILVIFLSLGLGGLGCAKHKSAPVSTNQEDQDVTDGAPAVDIPEGPYVPDGDGPGQGPGSNWQYGATAALSITDLYTMGEYTGRPMNNPKDIKINLNLRKYGKGYGGVVSIGYREDGTKYEGNFTSGTTKASNQYNIWFTKNGKKVWHGFFEDFMGGLVVVIDKVVDLGDGGSDDIVAGSVWFKNFGLTYAPNPLYGHLEPWGRPGTYCWFISLGPYDCRAWKKGDAVKTTKAVKPDSGYTKLGTFEGLSLDEAFNGDLNL